MGYILQSGQGKPDRLVTSEQRPGARMMVSREQSFRQKEEQIQRH